MTGRDETRLRSGVLGFNEGVADAELARRIGERIADEPTPARVGTRSGGWDLARDTLPSVDRLGPDPVGPSGERLRGGIPGLDPWEDRAAQRAEAERIADEVHATRHIVDRRKPWERDE